MKFFSSCFLLFLACVLFCECRRTNGPQPQGPDTTKVSNSHFDSMDIECVRWIGRDTLGNTGGSITGYANLYDSLGNSCDDLFKGHIFLNDTSMILRSAVASAPRVWFVQKVETNLGTTGSSSWKVISANGVTDLQFTDATASMNMDTMPKKIYCSSGVSLAVKESWFPGKDSIKIEMDNYSGARFDTTVSVHAGTIYFSPALFSGFLTQVGYNSGTIYIYAAEKHIIVVNGKSVSIKNYGVMNYEVYYYP